MDENRFGGTAKNVGGKVQEAAGKVAGNTSLEVRGKANQAVGQVEDIYGRWPWVERAVWTERMLEALERGPKHGVWHSLIDKVYAPRTLAAAWERVEASDGAGGVDQVSVGRFARNAAAEPVETPLQPQARQGPSAAPRRTRSRAHAAAWRDIHTPRRRTLP